MTFSITQHNESITSSFTLLTEQAKSDPTLPSGSVINAPHQTAGRGQGSNQWHSSYGLNLLPSIFIRLNHFHVNNSWRISEVVALSLYNLLQSYLPEPEHLFIKWPNDLIYKDQKIAGILISNQIIGSEITRTIIGIGLNVNEPSFPDDIPPATSLKLSTQHTYDCTSVLDAMLSNLSDLWEKHLYDHHHMIHDQYNQHLYRQGIESLFIIPSCPTPFKARIIQVLDNGQLQLQRIENQQITNYHFKEISLIR